MDVKWLICISIHTQTHTVTHTHYNKEGTLNSKINFWVFVEALQKNGDVVMFNFDKML